MEFKEGETVEIKLTLFLKFLFSLSILDSKNGIAHFGALMRLRYGISTPLRNVNEIEMES